MLLAVDFDHELARVAVEVDDKAIEGSLPAKFRPTKSRPAQPFPQDLLSARHLLSQGPGELSVGPLTPAPLPTGEGLRLSLPA